MLDVGCKFFVPLTEFKQRINKIKCHIANALMKIKYVSFLVSLFLATLILNSCGKSYIESCKSTIHTTLSTVSGGDSIRMNSLKSLDVYFDTYNGCGQFSHFEETSNGNTKTIKVFAKYDGCICTQVVKTVREAYNYTVPQTGIYIFDFVQPDNSHIIHTVTVF